MIEATYVLTLDDAMDAVKGVYRRDRTATWNRWAWIVVGLGLIAIVISQKPSPAYWLILLGLLFVWSGIRLPERSLKTHCEKSLTHELVVVHIDEAGVATVSPTARTEMKWAGFKSALETSKTFSFYSPGLLYVFPKRAFSEQACEELRKLIVKNEIPAKPR